MTTDMKPKVFSHSRHQTLIFALTFFYMLHKISGLRFTTDGAALKDRNTRGFHKWLLIFCKIVKGWIWLRWQCNIVKRKERQKYNKTVDSKKQLYKTNTKYNCRIVSHFTNQINLARNPPGWHKNASAHHGTFSVYSGPATLDPQPGNFQPILTGAFHWGTWRSEGTPYGAWELGLKLLHRNKKDK